MVTGCKSFMGRRRDVKSILDKANKQGWKKSIADHTKWWRSYWSQSSISLPDSVLERQWYLEQYKFGAASRRGAPPISLQAVWTADNGRIPPWKGDFHHDLNTQLSYWPCYSSNHLEEGLAFLDWLWKIKPQAEAYTKDYYDSDGLNVPGVTTLDGSPMGGWIQYSLGPDRLSLAGPSFLSALALQYGRTISGSTGLSVDLGCGTFSQ